MDARTDDDPFLSSGLTSADAARRLAADGPNALPSARRRWPAILREAASEPMFLLLSAAAALYLILGDIGEGLLLGVMVCATIGLTLFQEGRMERALEALRALGAAQATVLRDGQRLRIPADGLVCGDLLLVDEGDRVAADAQLLAADNLQLDESLLTGESLAVEKDVDDALYSGTLVVRGSARARITATGARSRLGSIGATLGGLTAERAPLQLQTARMVRVLAIAGIALAVLLGVTVGIQRGDWLQAALAGIALAIALLPEEFPVILAVFPAIGASRLARENVLTRRLASIEALGAVTVLCTDKTGTLTENRMRVVRLAAGTDEARPDPDGGPGGLSPAHAALARCAADASQPHSADPMEQAFFHLDGRAQGGSLPLRTYALSPALRAMTLVWPAQEGGAMRACAKGAPEAIARLCRLEGAALAEMQAATDRLAQDGLRVLAVAEAEAPAQLPDAQEGFAFRYLGLMALADPLRAEIPQAMQDCAQAGIRVLMITGDHPATALSIARQAGMPPGGVLAGAEMDSMNDDALRQRLAQCHVCARISPEQKLRLVRVLQANGEVVAMTGDGVNDAPALKAAHVGIAMGGRGAEVAREAAALVLLDDRFASIVRGIRLGRRIYANMQHAMAYVLAIHVPIAGMALLPALAGWAVLLYPAHIAFLELVIDPACALAFENQPSADDAMRQPPRRRDAPLVTRAMVWRALLQGAGMLAAVALAYSWARPELTENGARAFAFAVLVCANVMLILANLTTQAGGLGLSSLRNLAPWLIGAGGLCLLLLTLYVPPLAHAFRFAPLDAALLAMAAGAGFATILWFWVVKRIVRWGGTTAG